MKRREFITLLRGVVAAWPLGAHAQQADRMRRVFVVMGTANDAEAQARAEALHQGLQALGWTIGRNIQINYSFGSGDVERMRVYAKEAVASAPDLILVGLVAVVVARYCGSPARLHGLIVGKIARG